MKKNLRYFRYLVLLLILLFVIVNETRVKDRVASWDQTLQVQVFAINGDRRAATESYLKALKLSDFRPIEDFVNREAKRYGLAVDAIKISYAGELESGPPQPPLESSVLKNVFWSLHFRGWAWYQSYHQDKEAPDVNLFISYYDTSTTQSLRHSVGLQRGLIGLINGFASKRYNGSNNVVIAHELMHTLGASDKYDLHTGQPLVPDGLANPDQSPLYPQHRAEIMGAHIATSAIRWRRPPSLKSCMIGVATATEIGWL